MKEGYSIAVDNIMSERFAGIETKPAEKEGPKLHAEVETYPSTKYDSTLHVCGTAQNSLTTQGPIAD